ncbi:hypothetical protein SAV14893_066950 [Streptomyces avermitilis]|uniref:Uncharacterized protein n=1 Tax=Streptomyces avermitilis TaxID=33903 RepID=A0A4D4MMG7_STRAX|nr:hypothetical protein SAVMC3_79680 [Streptomyces avermitilis]GDY67302.1 hypothetical protein SAV14893_066950 [Streptomyces avermitilis]GDY72407.1 hypothetical protein SAV31267_018920 [Streptomyces avermitilis]
MGVSRTSPAPSAPLGIPELTPYKNHSTRPDPSTMIYNMFRYAFLLAASAVADAPKAAVPIIAAAVDGARS